MGSSYCKQCHFNSLEIINSPRAIVHCNNACILYRFPNQTQHLLQKFLIPLLYLTLLLRMSMAEFHNSH